MKKMLQKYVQHNNPFAPQWEQNWQHKQVRLTHGFHKCNSKNPKNSKNSNSTKKSLFYIENP